MAFYEIALRDFYLVLLLNHLRLSS